MNPTARLPMVRSRYGANPGRCLQSCRIRARRGAERNRSVGAGELEQQRKAHRAERDQLGRLVVVVPEVIKANAERRYAQQSSHRNVLRRSGADLRSGLGVGSEPANGQMTPPKLARIVIRMPRVVKAGAFSW